MPAGVNTHTRRERALLIAAGAFLLVNYATLALARGASPIEMWPVLLWAVCAFWGHRALRRALPHRDPFIFPLVMLLSGWGVLLSDRLAPSLGWRQPIWLAVSTLAMAAIARLPGDLRWLSRYRYTWLAAGLGLLALTLIFGVNPSGGGPRLWLVGLQFAGLYFQPSEVLKLALVIYMASYLAENREPIAEERMKIGRFSVPSMQFLGPSLLMWGLVIVIVVWQRDLGAAMLFFFVFALMLYITTSDARYLIVGGGGGLIASAAAYLFFGVVRQRIDIWLNPWPEASDRAFQIVQSLMAFAAGGVFGRGIGQGSPTFIPVVHSDFAFAAIAEEFGLVGVVVVCGLLAVLAARGFRIAAQSADRPFRLLLAAGLSLTLAAQSLMIMGGVLKIMPLTGMTLPFVSYGGSSLLSSFVMAGILLLMSDQTGRAASYLGRAGWWNGEQRAE